LLEKLSYHDQVEAQRKLDAIQLWTTRSANFTALEAHLHLLRRTTVTQVPAAFAQVYAGCGKLRRRGPNDRPILAWCNFFSRAELHKIPPRQRGLFEPLLNDLIRLLGLDVSVSYSTTASVREAVLATMYGVRGDMEAWFDELPAPDVSDFHGVRVEGDEADWSLEVVAMGSRPACRIAHTTLELIAPSAERPTPAGQAESLFVDNVNLLGQTPEECNTAMRVMQRRAASVGARLHIESPNGQPEQIYTFLGEKYNHITKERSLPAKHVGTAREMLDFIQHRDKGRMTAKQLMALMGSLTFGASVLDIDLTRSLALLKEHAEVARDAAHRGTWHHTIAVSAGTRAEIGRLLQVMVDNAPVHVTRGHTPPTATRRVEIFVDASRWGWGAIVIGTAGNVQHLQKQWTPAEHANHDTGSSVTTEPLAVRQMLCSIVEPNTHYVVHSDHEPMVWACRQRRWSATPQYNEVHRLLRDLGSIGVSAELHFVPGHKNPADALSRGQAPALPVTAIGGVLVGSPPMQREEGGVAMGARQGVGRHSSCAVRVNVR
jgi:hypothetical protein